MIRVPDRIHGATARRSEKAEPGNAAHVGAPMPGSVASVAVSEGQEVHTGEVLLTLEAMKMETALHAERDGVIERIVAGPGTQVDAKDLLIVFAE